MECCVVRVRATDS